MSKLSIKQISAFGKFALPTVSNEHNNIHGGNFFTAQVANAALGASALLYIEIIIPEEIELHLKQVSFYNGDDGHFELVEAPTLTTGAAVLTAFNRWRPSIKLSNILLKSNPTAISSGVVLDEMYFKGTNQAPGTLITSDWEWVLKSDTTYLIRLTNNGTGSEQALLKANWYERVI